MLEIWAGKLTSAALRVSHRGGTTLPGEVARRVSPFVLWRLAEQVPRRAVVTGTNGKTTTARMVAEACRRQGLRLVHNRSGANLLSGVTTAFVGAADWRGRLRRDVAVLEVDEASLERVVVEVRPQILAATNFFRDQLDRYGEVDRTVRHVEDAAARLPGGGEVLLNADDPLSVALAERIGGAAFFGVRVYHAEVDPVVDVRSCPRCGGELRYAGHTVAHLGDFRCGRCGLRRPPAEVEVEEATPQPRGLRLGVATPAGRTVLELPLTGLYNAYNAALAFLLASRIGCAEAFPEALARFRTSFGRMEEVVLEGRPATLVLVKNPTGFNAALRALEEREGDKVAAFFINDRAADGRDVSWLWDVDFERLGRREDVVALVTGGRRGLDMAVRLKYAGLAPRLQVAEGIVPALDRALAFPGSLYFFATYTALLELRSVLVRRKAVEAFWQE